MKVKWLAATFALLMAAALFAVDGDLTMHFIIDYSQKMQQKLPGSDKTVAEACYDEFVGQMDALREDDGLKKLRFRYDTVLQYRSDYRAKRGEWLHSSSTDTRWSGVISQFPRKEWLDTTLMNTITRRPHLEPSDAGKATETTDWDKYIEDGKILKERLASKNTLYVFFVYESPRPELIDKLNRTLSANSSHCIFFAMREGTSETATPENKVKRGFDEVRKLFREEFGKNAKIVCDAEGELYPGEYTFRIIDLGSDLPDGLEIKWSVSLGSRVIKSLTEKNAAMPLKMQLDDPGSYVIAAELKTSFRSITLKKNVEIKKPKYDFSVVCNGRQYRDGGTIRVESNDKVSALVKCEVTPVRELDNLKVVVKAGGDSRSYDINRNITLYPGERGDIILRDVKRNKDLAVIKFSVEKRVEETPAPAVEPPAPAVEPPAPVVEPPAPAVETPAETTPPEETSTPEVETPAETPPPKKAQLELISVTKEDGSKVDFADGIYNIELGSDQETAVVVFKLNRSCKMSVTGDEKAGEADTWQESFPENVHTIRFIAADGARCSLTLAVSKAKASSPSDNSEVVPPPPPPEDDSLAWLWILLGIAVIAAVAVIVLKKFLSGKIFFLNYAIGQADYKELEKPFAPGRYRIDDTVFENCLGPFMITLSQENADGDVLQKILFEQLPHDWKLAVGNKPKSLNNGTSEEFIIGSDEYVLTSPRGMMKIKIRIKGN